MQPHRSARPARPTTAACRWERRVRSMASRRPRPPHRRRAAHERAPPRGLPRHTSNHSAEGCAGHHHFATTDYAAGLQPLSTSWASTMAMPAVFRFANTLPGGCSPRSHSCQAACSLWRSGGGGTNDMRAGYRSSPRGRRTALTPLPTRRPAMRPTSVLRPPSADTFGPLTRSVKFDCHHTNAYTTPMKTTMNLTPESVSSHGWNAATKVNDDQDDVDDSMDLSAEHPERTDRTVGDRCVER